MLVSRARHLVTLQSVTRTRDSFGDAQDSISTLTKAWAYIDPLRGEERSNTQLVKATISHKIRMRYTTTAAQLKPDDRILYGSRIFDIDAVMVIKEQNRELEILATERV